MSENLSHSQEEKSTDTPSVKRTGKAPIVLGVVAAVVLLAGIGFYVWHEQPSFCNAVCHTPMDQYNATFDQELGVEGRDKWGNTVSDTSAMLCISHSAKGGLTCLSCHVPTMSEQISEGANWVTGNYVYPLEERTLSELTEAHGASADEFCLNENCHNMTRDVLAQMTSDRSRNPHESPHAQTECGECHKAHRASVMACSQCHDDVEVPEGWLTAKEASKLNVA